ncbi:MerR family transcriptional regulator [Paracnuella aquatica]|uniref:MerR family transcriptional regulator n=1 Tax=Paracnuella aquatica TaxID=2268757 RepID=UPI000DEF458A|nr:MerR family transcriptional regulator [Paracnuella aquatica]RPD48176.1 MerR family transcriptional regulator [Paracnuella aquatica]
MAGPLSQILFDFSNEEPQQPKEFLSGAPLPAPEPTKRTRGRKPLKPTEAGPDKVLVPEDTILFQKQYWGISEVAAMFGVPISQIRYWENEFPQLKPRKNGKGDRLFRPEDVKTLVLIHDLIRRRKYTLEGAREYLKRGAQAEEQFHMIQSLQKLRQFLLEVKAHL